MLTIFYSRLKDGWKRGWKHLNKALKKLIINDL